MMNSVSRQTYPGAYHHIITQCNNKEFLFKESADFEKYLEILFYYKKKFKVKLFHYCLLHNHVHLCLQVSGSGTISEVMKSINFTFSKWYNNKYARNGHFWKNRFKSYLIDNDIYLLMCGIYIELNAVRAGLVCYPEEWPYSSAKKYFQDEGQAVDDVSPAFESLASDRRARTARYKSLIYDEIQRVNRIAESIKNGQKETLLNLIKSSPGKPIPFKKQVFSLLNWREKSKFKQVCEIHV